ncbi:MAG: cyclic nucleotide-binding domain-containing protein [Verrucomicrobia bacterium]|nr:cyclic nucleotide-binding domain-containing protein [Verrucomicrobiota bacterium]
MKTITILKAFPAFARFSESELEFIARNMTLESFHAGEVILRENAFSNTLYIIVRGVVEVRKKFGDQEIAVAELCAGAFLGEGGVAGMDSHRSMAIAEAITPSEMLTLPGNFLDLATAEHPMVAVKLLRLMSIMLAGKLRRLNEEYVLLFLEHEGTQNISALRNLQEEISKEWGF